MGYQPGNFKVIPNGVNTHKFVPDFYARSSLRAELNLSADAFVIGQIARVDPMKGYDVLLDAVSLMSGVKCVMAGRGTEQLTDGDDIIGLGIRDDIPRVLNGLDVLVSCSLFGEGCSNAILEGMAAGLPIVTTDVGDARKLVGDAGIIVPPGQPDAVVEAIGRLLNSPDERRVLGRKARQRCEEAYSIDRMIGAFDRMYIDAMLVQDFVSKVSV